MGAKNDELRDAFEARSSEELVSILRNHDREQWREEVFAIVAAILAERGLSPAEVVALGPESVQGRPSDGRPAADDEETGAEAVASAAEGADRAAPRVAFEVFRGDESTEWEDLCAQVAAFANEIPSQRLISISQSVEDSGGVVTVWYWTEGER